MRRPGAKSQRQTRTLVHIPVRSRPEVTLHGIGRGQFPLAYCSSGRADLAVHWKARKLTPRLAPMPEPSRVRATTDYICNQEKVPGLRHSPERGGQLMQLSTQQTTIFHFVRRPEWAPQQPDQWQEAKLAAAVQPGYGASPTLPH